MNLFSILEDAAKKWPDDAAVVYDGRSFRYAELCAAAESLALKLRKLGLGGGDKVGVMLPNSPEYIAVSFAVLRLGAAVVPISPALKAAEFAALAEKIGMDAFCHSSQFSSVAVEGEQGALTEAPVFEGRPPLYVTVTADHGASQSERERLVKIKAATIRFSSGTTARAKGIIVSHASLFERAKTYCEALSLKKDDAVLWLRPMARSEILAFLLQGTTIVIGDAMDMDFLAGQIRRYGVTNIYAAPLFYRMILTGKDITPDDLRNVRHFLSGGSALSKQIADGFAAKYGREIVQHYGLAECSRVLMNLSQDPSKRGSVGLPVRAEVKLASEDGSPLEGEGSGELLVRCPGMFDAYYKPWRLREEVLENGWFRTGDIARRDKDGYYWIVGRIKDVINVGGVKVFPHEIEEALLSHPAVEEAVVYGAPEPRFGEAPQAIVKLRRGAVCPQKELLRHVNGRLSVFKALHGVEFVDEIPKTATGKLRRWD